MGIPPTDAVRGSTLVAFARIPSDFGSYAASPPSHAAALAPQAR
jgi:hypothetical protein